MTVIFDRPYEFVPPDRSNVGPWVIQRLRLVDRYLAKKECVIQHECRHWQKLRASVDAGYGVMVTPNHSSYADPLAMGWLGRYASVNFFAVASWHLFNTGWFDSFAMRKCGGFSLNREGLDRKSLEVSIECLAEAQRALILFPEGQTFRTNDQVRDLLDGATFIARSAARRRKKKHGEKVVVHPVGIKYLCLSKLQPWANQKLSQMESLLGWRRAQTGSPSQRLKRISQAILRLQEVQYLGDVQSGTADERRLSLANHLVSQIENRFGLSPKEGDDMIDRARVIRSKIALRYFELSDESAGNAKERAQLRDDDTTTDLAHWFESYSDTYFAPVVATDERIVETIQRLQEFIIGKASKDFPLKAVLEVGDSIDVPAEKAPKGVTDPLTIAIHSGISKVVNRLSKESSRSGT